MGFVEDVGAKLLRQLADAVEAGLVDVHHEKRVGCGATGCEELDYRISVQHRHIPTGAGPSSDAG